MVSTIQQQHIIKSPKHFCVLSVDAMTTQHEAASRCYIGRVMWTCGLQRVNLPTFCLSSCVHISHRTEIHRTNNNSKTGNMPLAPPSTQSSENSILINNNSDNRPWSESVLTPETEIHPKIYNLSRFLSDSQEVKALLWIRVREAEPPILPQRLKNSYFPSSSWRHLLPQTESQKKKKHALHLCPRLGFYLLSQLFLFPHDLSGRRNICSRSVPNSQFD